MKYNKNKHIIVREGGNTRLIRRKRKHNPMRGIVVATVATILVASAGNVAVMLRPSQPTIINGGEIEHPLTVEILEPEVFYGKQENFQAMTAEELDEKIDNLEVLQ
jgi:hypothetical protein